MAGMGGVGSAAASTAPHLSWPSWVAHPASLSCQRGATLVAPTRAWTDALGVAHFTYRAAPGMESSLLPKGLTASQATPAMLADIGMPRSAAGTRFYRHNVSLALAQARHPRAVAFCRSMTTPDRFVPARRPAHPPSVNFAHIYGNWGGYAVTEAENGGAGINSVEGTWTQGQDKSPNFASSTEATWVGLGGGAAQESTWGLIQTGTSMRTNNGYQTWFEYIDNTCQSGPCAPHYTTTGKAGPGDVITAEAWWASSTSACFFLEDSVHASADIPTICLNPGITYDHTSAEWVNEDPPASPTMTIRARSSGRSSTSPMRSPSTGPLRRLSPAPSRPSSWNT